MIGLLRAVLGFAVFAAVTAAAVYFADHPGQVAITWQGWEVGTTVGVLAAAAVLAGILVAALLWVLSSIVGAPQALSRRRRERRRRAGYRALTQGMVAVAAGDPQEAQRHARRADTLLADPPLTLLLSAQAAQLEGDDAAAKKFFAAMLDRPETEFLGLRGLLNQALQASDRGTALGIAKRAMSLRPSTPWVIETVFDLEAREERWQAAEGTLAQAVKRKLVPRERARHHRGVMLYERSLAALARGDRRQGINLAAEARSLAADLATPAAHHARLLLADRRTGPAAKAIEGAWRTAPHPDLAEVYAAIHQDAAPLARFKCFEKLAAQNRAARESSLTLAEAALDAQLWGEARHHLEEALAAPAPPSLTRTTKPLRRSPSPAACAGQPLTGPTPRICLMMARLEEGEHGSGSGMREWLDRTATAMPDPRYVCADCGGESLEWHSLCPHCGAFDRLAWRTPAWSARADALAHAPPISISQTHEEKSPGG
jgi:HemY protein